LKGDVIVSFLGDRTGSMTTGSRNDNEIKVGYALIDILGNWEETLDVMNGGSKFNKNSVLETMRNYTNLSTKDIRASMKRYKDIYSLLKIYTIENGF
jgi:hypothetical protein